MSGDPSLMIDAVQPVNLTHPLNRGLLRWWLVLPGMAGSVKWPELTQFSNPARAGTLTNIAVPATATSGWQPASRSGSFGSLGIDGSDDLVVTNLDVSQINTAAATDVTYSAWIRSSRGSASDEWLYVGNEGGTFHNNAVAQNTSDKYFFNNYDGSEHRAVADNVIVFNTWYHVVGIRRSSTNYLYVNGIEQSTPVAAGNPTITAGKTFRIGAGFNKALGRIDDIRVYNRALTRAEVTELYCQSLRGHPDTLRRIRSRAWSFGIATGNRRRRVICGS